MATNELPTNLKRTDNPRGFHAKRLLAEQGYVAINPEIVEKIGSVEHINKILENYIDMEKWTNKLSNN